jgi:prepilin-type N-terminal cleavage/methylation domain-containing protein
MRNKKGFTVVELMIVVAIIPVLGGMAIPMYNADLKRTELQEATDTIGAIKDEVCRYAAETGAPPGPWGDLDESEILTVLGLQVPVSLGVGGGRKWRYSTIDNIAGRIHNGTYVVRATGGAAADIGSYLSHVQVDCIGAWDPINGEFTSWRWECPNHPTVAGWLPD